MSTNREQLIKEIALLLAKNIRINPQHELCGAKKCIEALASFIQARDKQIWDAASETYGYDRENPYQTGNLKYPTLESYLTSLTEQNKE